MSVYYIEFVHAGRRELFSFDCTNDIRLNESGSTTNFPVGKFTYADHYINANLGISMSGSISDIKARSVSSNPDFAKPTEVFISRLRALKQSGTPFKIYLGDNFATVNNCVFDTLEIAQDKSRGTRVTPEGQISAFYLSFTAKQIRFGSKAKIVQQPVGIIAASASPPIEKSAQVVEASKEVKTKAKKSMLDQTAKNLKLIWGAI